MHGHGGGWQGPATRRKARESTGEWGRMSAQSVMMMGGGWQAHIDVADALCFHSTNNRSG